MSQLGSSSAVQPLKCLTSHRSRHTGSPSSSGSKRFKSHVSIAQHEVLFPHLLVLVFDQQLLDKVVPVDAEPPSQLIITIHNNIIHQFALLTDEVACRLYVRLSSAKLPNPVCFIVSQISPFSLGRLFELYPYSLSLFVVVYGYGRAYTVELDAIVTASFFPNAYAAIPRNLFRLLEQNRIACGLIHVMNRHHSDSAFK